MVAPNEDSHLFFQGGVAAQKLYASCLQGLHACVLIDGIGVVGIFGSRFRLQPALTSIEGVLHRGLSDCRVGYVQPLADFVLVPDIVVVVQQVGGAVKRSHDLDLILRNSETESQAIQGILDATQGRPIVDANDVEYLFDSGRVVGELLNSASFHSEAFQTSCTSATRGTVSSKPNVATLDIARHTNDRRVAVWPGHSVVPFMAT